MPKATVSVRATSLTVLLRAADVYSNVSLPLTVIGSQIFAAPGNDSIFVVNTSTMVIDQEFDIEGGSNNSGPAWINGDIYVAAGTKAEEYSSTGTKDWTYTADAAINSGIIMGDSIAYFSDVGSKAYAISVNSETIKSGGPKTISGSNVNRGPWIENGVYNYVIFGTAQGEVYAYPLE